MKTYEITATLHDGRVVYRQQVKAKTVMDSILTFYNLHKEQSSKIQNLIVSELTT